MLPPSSGGHIHRKRAGYSSDFLASRKGHETPPFRDGVGAASKAFLSSLVPLRGSSAFDLFVRGLFNILRGERARSGVAGEPRVRQR
jgi:hypothetical protein